jgi:hypothetical protein
MFKDFDYGMLNEEPKTFLSAVSFLKQVYLKNNLDVPSYPQNILEVPLDEHPRIMRDLLQKGVYQIRDEVKELIRKG